MTTMTRSRLGSKRMGKFTFLFVHMHLHLHLYLPMHKHIFMVSGHGKAHGWLAGRLAG